MVNSAEGESSARFKVSVKSFRCSLMGIRKQLMRSQSNADPANYVIKFCKAKIKRGWEIIVSNKMLECTAHTVFHLSANTS